MDFDLVIRYVGVNEREIADSLIELSTGHIEERALCRVLAMLRENWSQHSSSEPDRNASPIGG